MSFALPPEAMDWAAKARAFVDAELIPHELYAELHEGRLPDGVAERHERLAIGLGFSRMDAPRGHGGLELPVLTQTAIVEQLGRVTNALSWCYPEAQAWMFAAFSADQIERHAKAMMEGIWLDLMTMQSPISREEGLRTVLASLGAFFPKHFTPDGEVIA